MSNGEWRGRWEAISSSRNNLKIVFDCRPLGKSRSERGEQARAGREGDEGLTAVWEALMVARQPTPADDPGKAALDHPSSGQRSKAGGKEFLPVDLLSLGHEQAPLGDGEGAHRLHGPAHMLFEPPDEGAAVMAITPHQLDAGKALFQRLAQHPRSFLIGALSTEHFDPQEMALRIHHQESFAYPE